MKNTFVVAFFSVALVYMLLTGKSNEVNEVKIEVPYSALTMYLTHCQKERDSATGYSKLLVNIIKLKFKSKL